MKNIHVLPTDKPSRLLYFGTSKELTLQVNPATFRVFERSTQNIYITSNEDIKEGDYIFEADTNKVNIAGKDYHRNEFDFKIILTTDQDLIADGVQAIDDEFLEWFVKNPSCESVEVKCYSKFNDGDFSDYKIFEEKLKHINKIIIPQEEPKQETLEEAAEKWYDSTEENKGFPKIKAFKEGAKWQQEQDKKLYSEEEVLDILREFYKVSSKKDFPLTNTIPLWFEQFKNK
jgi:hypothetical protein